MTISIVVLVLVVAIVGYGILDQTVLRGQKPVAVVGRDKITTTEFEKTVRYSRWQMVQQYDSTLALHNHLVQTRNLPIISSPPFHKSKINYMIPIQLDLLFWIN